MAPGRTAAHPTPISIPNNTGADSPAPDSPRASQSPPPVGLQGDLELELLGLANALYNLGTTVISDNSKDRDKPGSGKQVGLRVNEVIGHLASIDELSTHVHTMIPAQVLADIDNAKNPMHLTRDRLERAATENQFMNGKINAIASYRGLLNDALAQAFPDIAPHLQSDQPPPAETAPPDAEPVAPGANGVAKPPGI